MYDCTMCRMYMLLSRSSLRHMPIFFRRASECAIVLRHIIIIIFHLGVHKYVLIHLRIMMFVRNLIEIERKREREKRSKNEMC